MAFTLRRPPPASHRELDLGPGADEAITRYLVDGQLPAVGAVCEPDEVPFAAG
jgi:hypothetical protein